MNEEAPYWVSELSIGSTQYRLHIRPVSQHHWLELCRRQQVYREPDYGFAYVPSGLQQVMREDIEYTAICTERETDTRLMPFSYF